EFSTPTGIKEECKEKFASILAEFSTVRKRKDVMPWLPEKDYCPIRLQLTPKQKNYLQQLETWFEIEGTDIVTTGILDRLIRYRQICLAPELLGLKGGSPKTDYILQYIQDYPDESIIIFSSFTQYIKILQKKIPTARMIIGETPIPKRAEYCKAFQEGKIKILLINIQAGKEALTLDKATTTIFTDKFPPIGDITQAEDRFVATRPDIADKEHKIVELMMANSYDEMIYDLLAKRYSETDVINNYKNYIMKGVDVNGITS
ncbi:MAG: hypothetical protein EOM67_11030, partial [Spirochaetia bacterium]|nr:hypothetical protein [Spirochaetia bacterium]